MGQQSKKPCKLTDEFVRKLQPKGDRRQVRDDAVTGFGVNVYPGGTRSFFFGYYLDGRERQRNIGEFPAWSVAAAREQAKEFRKQVDQGRDPADERRAARKAATVVDLIDRYIAEHMPSKRLAGPRRNDELRMLEEIGKGFGKRRKVVDIHGGDARELHRQIGESIGRGGKPRTIRANRVATLGHTMFQLALVPKAGEALPWRNAALGNPFKGIKRYHEEAREKFFSQAELTAIGDALAEYPGVAADCARLIMLTGCRPDEARQAQWSEFDEQPGYWIKPSAHTKQKKVHKLPLSPAAIELIERLRKKRRNNKWTFPGDKPGEPLAALWHCWHFVRDRAGLGKDARLYDLRHTFASVGAGGGLSLLIIGKLLGHTQQRTTQRYAHLADDPLREAAEKITTVITGAGKTGAKVVTLKGERR